MKLLVNKIESFFNTSRLKTTIIWTFIFGMIAHAFCFFNANFSSDSMYYLKYSGDYTKHLQMGRFLRPVYYFLKNKWILPWLNGFLFLFFLSISIYIINETLKITEKNI